MRFFTDDSGRRPGALWTWRSTAVVTCLALVTSLAVGLGAAGGLSVLDEPAPIPPAVPPLADSRPAVPLPLDGEPPPTPNTAAAAEPEPPPGDSAPPTSDTAQTATAGGHEPDRTEPAPPVEADVDDTVEEGWNAVDDTVAGAWNAVDDAVDALSATGLFGGDESHCPQPEAFDQKP